MGGCVTIEKKEVTKHDKYYHLKQERNIKVIFGKNTAEKTDVPYKYKVDKIKIQLF